MRVCYDWEYLVKFYRKIVNKSSVVLEIGASNAARTKDLAKYCKKILGVEKFSERKPVDFENVKYVLGDWENLGEVMKAESIDAAVASHVIEHVKNDLKAINELYKVLKPGGVAIINTPNRKRLTRVVIEKFTGEKKFPCGEHEREYTEEDLISLMSRSKFKKYKIEPVVFGLHGGPVFWYSKKVWIRKYANFWQTVLIK